MDSSEFQSLSNLLIYFGTCGCVFLVISIAFCVYKNLRTLPSQSIPASESFLLPPIPEADFISD